jgi:hypothetical protein
MNGRKSRFEQYPGLDRTTIPPRKSRLFSIDRKTGLATNYKDQEDILVAECGESIIRDWLSYTAQK